MAVRKLRSHAMPPPKEPRPDESAARSRSSSWLEDALDEAAADERTAIKPIVPHRLNRKEYANAVRDLLALEVDGMEFLPQDEEVKHFDNIASGLQVSPSFIEQYVGAARQIAVRAVGRPDARTGGQTLLRAARAPAVARARLAARHARRLRRDAFVPVRRRIRSQHRRHVQPHLGQRLGVREHGRRDLGQQDRLRDDGRRRGGHAPLRPGAKRRDGEDQRALEGHPFRRDGGAAQGRRHVPPPHVRRVRRSAADVRAGRRSGPRVPRAVVRGQRPVQSDGLERHAEPRPRFLFAIRRAATTSSCAPSAS